MSAYRKPGPLPAPVDIGATLEALKSYLPPSPARRPALFSEHPVALTDTMEDWARRRGLACLHTRNILEDRLYVVLGRHDAAPQAEADELRAILCGLAQSPVVRATSRAIARDPNSTADQLRMASILYPDDVRANPALALLAMADPRLGEMVGGRS